MALTRVRRTINLGNGWKQVVYLNPYEFASFQLFIVLPIQLIILIVQANWWVGVKLPLKVIKYIYMRIRKYVKYRASIKSSSKVL